MQFLYNFYGSSEHLGKLAVVIQDVEITQDVEMATFGFN